MSKMASAKAPASKQPSKANGKSKPKAVLSDDSDEDVGSLTINKKFAEEFTSTQKKAEQDRKKSFLQRVAKEELAAAGGLSDSGDSEHDESESEDESEDEDGKMLSHDLDKKILSTLAAIRRKDEDIYKGKVFFEGKEESEESDAPAEDDKKPKSKQKMTVKDAIARTLAEGDDSSEDEEAPTAKKQKKLTPKEEEARLRQEFLKAQKEAEDDDENEDELFAKRSKPSAEAEKAAGSDSPLMKYLPADEDKLSKDEKFLRDFVLGEWWKEKDPSKLPSYEEIVGEAEPEQPDISEDEEYLDKQDDFEAQYNFRFEEPGGSQIVFHPREIADSVRNKESKRKQQREAKKEREVEKQKQKQEEIKRLKAEKKKEILSKLAEIRDITGSTEGFSELDLSTDFNPDEYDKKMATLFSDDFYDEEVDDEELVAKIAEEVEQEKEAIRKPGRYLMETKKKLKSSGNAELAQKIEQKLEELYKLDFEDVIADGIATRFKYVPVAPQDFGLSVEDILNADDKELNKKVSIKKLAPYRTKDDDEKQERGRKRWMEGRKFQKPRDGSEPAGKGRKNLGSRARKRLARRKGTEAGDGAGGAESAASEPPVASSSVAPSSSSSSSTTASASGSQSKKRKRNRNKSEAESAAADE